MTTFLTSPHFWHSDRMSCWYSRSSCTSLSKSSGTKRFFMITTLSHLSGSPRIRSGRQSNNLQAQSSNGMRRYKRIENYVTLIPIAESPSLSLSLCVLLSSSPFSPLIPLRPFRVRVTRACITRGNHCDKNLRSWAWILEFCPRIPHHIAPSDYKRRPFIYSNLLFFI